MRNIFSFCIVFLMCTAAFAKDPNWSEDQWQKFLATIRLCETNGQPNDGIGCRGDGGQAYGPFQIHKAYFIDAVDYDKSITGKWEDCLTDVELSKRVVRAYIKRYLAKGGTVEDAARIHNGGPCGANKTTTLPYLKKFKRYAQCSTGAR